MPKVASQYIAPISPLHNRGDGELVDELGVLRAEAADLKNREDAIKAELIARGVREAEGSLFRATVTEALRETLDAQAIRKEMGESWCSARAKISVVVSVKITARTGTAKRATA